MKKVRINTGYVGLVFRKGNYKRVIAEGLYWLGINEIVVKYDLTRPFTSTVDLNILLRDEELATMLTVVDVKDNEIVLQFINGNFNSVLTSGRYAFWKGVTEYKLIKVDMNDYIIADDIDKNILQNKTLVDFVRVLTIEPNEKGVLIIDGKMEKVIDPGTYYFWKNATKINIAKTDLRTQQLEISGQELLTRDKAAIRINFQTKYKTVDIVKALLENKEYEKQIYILMQLALREYVGMYTLDELLEKKESVSNSILSVVALKAESLGVEILDCGIRDIILPGDVRDIMNKVLIATKQAQANIVTRREETASTRSLLNTAKLMEDNNMLFKLKEMEYVEKIADKINSISLSGGSQIVDQLRDIFTPSK